MTTVKLVNSILEELNLEFLDIAPEDLTNGSAPDLVIKDWNAWNTNEDGIRQTMVQDWLQRTSLSTLDDVKAHIKTNRHRKLYNNLDYLKLVLEQSVQPEDLCWFKELLEDDDPAHIETLRSELGALLRNAYDKEIAQGLNPDPLEYYDAVGDIRLIQQ
jgi:hypothetical protein